MLALKIKNLSKTYSSGLRALKGISLEVNQGDFFALLGPNGAGKSTTIGIITTLINKTAGEVEVFGNDIEKDIIAAKSCIGLVPQEFNFNMFEKVIDIVVCQAGYYGLSRKFAIERAKKYLTKLGLWEKRNEVSRTLSGGMKRRLMIARALMHEPKMLILDEPTAGVDIELRRSTWKFLQEINSEGTTIILTTHYLEEAEYLCKGIAIIDRGEIIENTTVKEMLNKIQSETFVLDLDGSINGKTLVLPGFDIVTKDSATLEVGFSKQHNLNELFNYLSEQGITVQSMRNKANRLEELFINLVKEGEDAK